MGDCGLETLERKLREGAIPEDPNVYYAGPMGMEAMFGRILVVEDDFRSGYECETCSKTGSVSCENCKGNGANWGTHGSIPKKCSFCQGSGKVKCNDCNGKGELIVIPETSQRRPTTGQVVSIGTDVHYLKRGDYVCYSNFVGEVWDLAGLDHDGIERKIAVRHMKESEVICRVTNHLSLKRMRNRQNQSSG